LIALPLSLKGMDGAPARIIGIENLAIERSQDTLRILRVQSDVGMPEFSPPALNGPRGKRIDILVQARAETSATRRRRRGHSMEADARSTPKPVSTQRESDLPWHDLRGWVAQIERHGELKRIAAEVDPNEELGAVTLLASRQEKSPALMFEKLRGDSTGSARAVSDTHWRSESIPRRAHRK
jgi:hypothetical protein